MKGKARTSIAAIVMMLPATMAYAIPKPHRDHQKYSFIVKSLRAHKNDLPQNPVYIHSNGFSIKRDVYALEENKDAAELFIKAGGTLDWNSYMCRKEPHPGCWAIDTCISNGLFGA